MKGTLNLFQATMLRWRALYPYNAVHAVAVERPLDAPQVRAAIAATLEAWGLTGLHLAGRHYEYRGGPATIAMPVMPGGDDPEATLAAEMERQLNLAFPREGAIEPFRPFAIEAGGRFHLGLAYDHFVAAGDSIVLLLEAIVRRIEGREPAPAAPERYPPRCSGMLARNGGAVLRGLRRVPALAASCRRAVRPRYRHPEDGRNGLLCFDVDGALADGLRARAKALGITLNDALLALALAAVAPMAGPREAAGRRHEIGVASIANIRGEFGPAARGAFGQFLASFRVSHPYPPGTALDDLARDLSAQTAHVKREKLYLQSLLAMAASGLYWRFLDDRRRARMHAKSYPTLAGLSNLDVNALWQQAGGLPAPDYLRAVPTGPLSPVVFAVTSSGPRLRVAVSFRTTAVDRAEVATISGLFLACARRFAA